MTPSVVHVVGARPNFVKAAPVIKTLAPTGVSQQLVDTGQHYDPLLSAVFVQDLDMPEPDVRLGVGSGTHAEQTAGVLLGVERVLAEIEPALLVVYGDVNSTLAAALAAAKLGVPVAHVEAGLRSFDDSMPEEINRRLTDALSTLLFVTSEEGVTNLVDERIARTRIHFVGNPMIDTLHAARPRLDAGAVATLLGLEGPYGVVTLHRPANVDDPARAARIARGLRAAGELVPLVAPLHPRGRAAFARMLEGDAGVQVVEPLGYLDFMALLTSSRLAITDSGGIQEETTALGVPCVTVRPNTERPVTVTRGTNVLCEPEAIENEVRRALYGRRAAAEPPPLWDGSAAPRIAEVVTRWLRSGEGS